MEAPELESSSAASSTTTSLRKACSSPMPLQSPENIFKNKVLVSATKGWFWLLMSFWSHKDSHALPPELLLSQESGCAWVSTRTEPVDFGRGPRSTRATSSRQKSERCPRNSTCSVLGAASHSSQQLKLVPELQTAVGGGEGGTAPIPILRRIKPGLYCNPPLHSNQSPLLITERSNASQGSFSSLQTK